MRPFLFSVLLFLAACGGSSPQDETPLKHLDKAPEADMEELLCLDSIGMFGATDFAMTDSVLWLLFQRPGSEDVLARCGLNGEGCKSVLKRGRGPGEMITATGMDDNGHIVIADCNTNQMASVVGDTVSLRQLPSGGLVTCITDSERVISTGIYPEGRYRLLNLKTGRAACFGDYPPTKNRIGDELLPTAYINSKLAMKPDRTRFVCVNSNCGVIEINAIAGDSIFRTARIVCHYPHAGGTRSGKMAVAAIHKSNVNGFFDVTCSDERIYTIYSGKTFREAGLDIENCDYVVTFDWSGKLIGVRRVPQPLAAIQFDNTLGRLYGLANTTSGSWIYRLHLNL